MRIVLVEPLYDSNVGKVCRVMKNFGFRELYLVNPQAPCGAEAEKYAKHAVDILKKAKIVKTFDEAVKGCYPIVGTTASLHKGESELVRPKPLSKAIGKIKGKKTAIVFGREDIGLDKDTLLKCDESIYIETSGDYESLNLSNAVAIVLYAFRLRWRDEPVEERAGPRLMRQALLCADEAVDAISKELLNPVKCKRALKNAIVRSNPTSEELRTIICVLKRFAKKMH